MSLSYDNNGGLVMPVSPMAYGNGGNGFLGGDGAWWLIVLLLIGWGGNGFGNFGGNAGMPYMMNNTANDVQRGFDQSAVMNGLTGINSAITNLGTAMNSAFANAETAENARQMANMQQAFNLSTQFANCCCENRLASANLNATILAENCADRAAVSDALRDVIANQNQGVQRILDTLCQDKIDAKNEKIAELQSQLTAANLAASQNNLANRLLADNAAQTAALEQYLNPAPIPAYVVQNPNGCASMYNYGCGCNG